LTSKVRYTKLVSAVAVLLAASAALALSAAPSQAKPCPPGARPTACNCPPGTSSAYYCEGPRAITGPARNITDNSARLTGTVYPGHQRTRWFFEWSRNRNNLHNRTTHQFTGTRRTHVSWTLGNLRSRTKYYYRLVARNPNGISFGAIRSFRTKGISQRARRKQGFTA
jgi:hypothetical protein